VEIGLEINNQIERKSVMKTEGDRIESKSTTKDMRERGVNKEIKGKVETEK
jgi:hypothetical protein